MMSLMKIYDTAYPSPPTPFDRIPDQVQTVIASVAFQYGDLSGRCPHFWSTAIRQNWSAMINELEHFGDSYGPRRLREAAYLRLVLTA